MTRLSDSKKTFLNQLVITCEICRLTEKESLFHIKKRFGRKISRRTFYQIKSMLYREKILLKHGGQKFMGRKPLLPESRFLNPNNEASKRYTDVKDLDFVPEHLHKLISGGYKFINRFRSSLSRKNHYKKITIKNYESVPSNVTLRKEYIKCGNYYCRGCKHGPYYYAYWRDQKGKLCKKYLGKYDPRDNDAIKLTDIRPLMNPYV
jgi:hypothetical protein